jgi:methylmalonyl-CoA decarboxylase
VVVEEKYRDRLVRLAPEPKSPLAIAVIKEQLRVLSDYQPIDAQVYERVQALRREAYDSSHYPEGLNAFAQKRQPIFRGT